MSDEKDIPAIPRAGLDSTVWQRLEAMREAIQKLIGTRGRDGDAAVRWADLAADGVGDVRRRTVTITDRVSELVQGGSGGGTGGGYEPDLTKPPTPTGLTVAAGFSNLLIEWTAPSYTAGHGNKFTHIYATKQAAASSTLYTFDDAVEINQVPGAASLCAHPSDLGVKWRIWIKFESNDGQFSDPHGGVNGFVVTTGKVGTSDLNDAIIEAAKLADGSITADKFNSGIEPVTIVSAVPGAKVTNTIFNTADGKLYRWSGAAYVKTIPTADLTGTVTDAQIAGMAASKVTGTLTDSQLAAIAAAKVTGQIVGTQITDGAVTTAKLFAGSVTTAKIAADAVTSTEIAAGAVTASEIAAGAVTTAKLAAGAVTANEIAAGAVVAGKVAANAITATELAADSVTAGKVAAGAITTSKLFVSGAGAALNADPSGMDSTAWTNSPVMLTGQSDMPAGSTAIANTTGAGKDVLTAELIPIEQLKRYRVEALVKQTVGSTGTMYLGVAWYDANKNLLTSNAAQPGGAGSPAGWSNGTYSYFGLIGAAAPATWTRYVTSFGPNESKAIPTNAKYIKLVALLNYGGTAGVQHAVSSFKLMEKADADLIVDGSIVASKLAANAIAVGSAAIQDGAITNAMLGSAVVDAAKIANAAIATAKIADGAITTAKIADAQITNAKIGLAAIETAKIADGAITTAKIADAQITSAKIGLAAIATAKIADGAITTAKIADAQITNAKIADLSADKITSGFISADRINADSLTADKIDSRNLTLKDPYGNVALSYGSGFGRNLCPNSDLSGSAAGWSIWTPTPGTNMTNGTPIWIAPNTTFSAGSLGATSTAWNGPTTTPNAVGSLNMYPAPISVSPGQKIEAQGLVWVGGGYADFGVSFLRGDKSFIENRIVSGGVSRSPDEVVFVQNWGFVTAPDDAKWAYIDVIVYRTRTDRDTNVIVAKPYIGYATAFQAERTFWHSGPHQITPANKSLYIANLTVDTLQIAGNAVTIPLQASWSGYQTGTGQRVATASADFYGQAVVINTQLIYEGYYYDSSPQVRVGIYRNGGLIASSVVFTHTGNVGTFIFIDFPPAGTHTYGVGAASCLDAAVTSATIIALGAKR